MERQLDFTLSPNFTGFPALITRMKKDGMRVILILVSPYEGAKSLFRTATDLDGENFIRIVFPSLLWVEKLRFRKKSIFPRVHRSSTVQMEAHAFPFEECLFPRIPSHSLALVFSPDLSFDFRTQPFPEMRRSPILHSRGAWRITSLSKIQLVETFSGERYDLCGDPLIPSWAWGAVSVCVCVRVVF